MIIGSILGLLAVVLLLMSMPCISLGNEAQSSKNKRAILGGVLMVAVGERHNYLIQKCFFGYSYCYQNATINVNDIHTDTFQPIITWVNLLLKC